MHTGNAFYTIQQIPDTLAVLTDMLPQYALPTSGHVGPGRLAENTSTVLAWDNVACLDLLHELL